jgi:hypothetical protein
MICCWSRPQKAQLGEGADYTGEYRIVDSKEEWVRLQLRDGGGGWTSVDAFCDGACQKLLEAASFTNDILAVAAGSSKRHAPRTESNAAHRPCRPRHSRTVRQVQRTGTVKREVA